MRTVKDKRDGRGRFVSGNSVARLSRGVRRNGGDVKEMLRGATADACRRLIELLQSDSEKVALACAREILDRVLGKPVQSVQADISASVTPAALLDRLRARGGAADDERG